MKSLKMMILVFLLLAVCLSASADTVPLDYADPGSWVSLPQEAVFSRGYVFCAADSEYEGA